VYCKEQHSQWYAGKLLKKTVGSQAPFLLTAAATPINKKRKDDAIVPGVENNGVLISTQ